MKPHKYLISIIALLLLSILTAGLQGVNAQPTVWTVSPSGPSDYHSIGPAFKAAAPGDIILVAAGVYLESLTVNKSITIIGENPKTTFIRGSNQNGAALNITADNVIVCNFSIRNLAQNTPALTIFHTSNVTIANNTITNSPIGITLYGASTSTIANNTLTANTYALLTDSYTHNNTLYQNCIINNTLGLSLGSSYQNIFYHNNFINNTAIVSGGLHNDWDNGYPDGGNFWSNFVGTDQFFGVGQNISGKDGIADTQYTLAVNNTDRYPLMHPYYGIAGDLNKDNAVNFDDILYFVSGFSSYWSTYTILPQYRVCDMDGDGLINIADLLRFSSAFVAYNKSLIPN
ncbi:MAG: NosD domain-containing protein [Candidatus Bathyarchaeia archaeon]|jgi:parallel beta-helix repeat protein